ncbi:hypothetical protein EG327_002505 [Venturia inaequalis]|uniref:non-specific serine/threonine protein kinase n=1 Tax=Venturia inaequalis TaxID=5025 RepID=A0A8H3VKQ1_VENIN|nr:hypothetical protein EG327_002505 [Venturia inaequalis]
MPFHNIFSKKNKKTCRGTSRIHRTVSRVLKRFRVKKTRIDVYQETRRLHKSSECMVEDIMATNVPMLDGEYDFSAGAGGHSTIVRRSNQIPRPSFMTGDNAQDSFTPSPPFGPIDILTSNTETTSYRGSSMPLHLSTDPTSQSSSGRDSRLSGLVQPPLQQKASLTSIPEWPNRVLEIPADISDQSMNCSIETVERAAAAKIFLETHFNQLLTEETSPHSYLRRCINEENFLFTRTMTSYQASKLRQTRALKSSRRPNKKDKVAAANLEVLRVLGKGSFGVVKLVRKICHPRLDSEQGDSMSPRRSVVDLHKVKKELFAMKVIPKSKNLRNSQEGHLHAERDFLVESAHNRWVVQLYASFQDDSFLYLVMEFMVGGDFLAMLLREDVLPEATTRWYIAEMILCVEEVHKMKWIHRDLKPDNFLISSTGHLKISDFGLAFDGHWSHHQQYYNKTRETLCESLGIEVFGDADDVEQDVRTSTAQKIADCMNGISQTSANRSVSTTGIRAEGHLAIDHLNTECKRSLAKSVVGTSQYMAPEVIRGDHYDGRCDYWSIGVIAYECLYGRTPFYCETRDDTKRKVLDHHLHLRFPSHNRYHRPQSAHPTLLPPVSDNAINLIARLLTHKEERLSCRRYRDNDIRGRRNGRSSHRSPYFVHPFDAEDIKNDAWFHNVPWDSIHKSIPPWLPTVKRDQDLAKWFESEDQILGTSDMIAEGEEGGPEIDPSLNQEKRKKAPVKRARDKILRDPVAGPVAMEVRKRNAFLGYTWHRSDIVGVLNAAAAARGGSSGGVDAGDVSSSATF